jgi:hypothetical protein
MNRHSTFLALDSELLVYSKKGLLSWIGCPSDDVSANIRVVSSRAQPQLPELQAQSLGKRKVPQSQPAGSALAGGPPVWRRGDQFHAPLDLGTKPSCCRYTSFPVPDGCLY